MCTFSGRMLPLEGADPDRNCMAVLRPRPRPWRVVMASRAEEGGVPLAHGLLCLERIHGRDPTDADVSRLHLG